jgi:hypothetical protein
MTTRQQKLLARYAPDTRTRVVGYSFRATPAEAEEIETKAYGRHMTPGQYCRLAALQQPFPAVQPVPSAVLDDATAQALPTMLGHVSNLVRRLEAAPGGAPGHAGDIARLSEAVAELARSLHRSRPAADTAASADRPASGRRSELPSAADALAQRIIRRVAEDLTAAPVEAVQPG